MEFSTDELFERFSRYARIHTTSDTERADAGEQPSTERQLDLARLLADELRGIGLSAEITGRGYVVASLEANGGEAEPTCFLAHLDTAEDVSGEDVRPILHRAYSGGRIELSEGVALDPSEDAELRAAAGGDIVTADGRTLLGADDKAGITAIMAALGRLVGSGGRHGKIEVVFSPDEETGHGMDGVPLGSLESKVAYTVDGGAEGELEAECFNAWKSEVVFAGNAVHTGSARGILVNALVAAAEFVTLLPRHESPETTDGRLGFYAPISAEGAAEKASATVLLRDFSTEGIERRKRVVDSLARAAADSVGASVEVTHTFQYANMRARLDENPRAVERAAAAYRAAGVEPRPVPIRGGTDGSRLTEMGIPAPNLFTGGHNFHSRREWLSLGQLAKAAEVVLNLMLG